MEGKSGWESLGALLEEGLAQGAAPAIEGWVAHRGRRVFHGGDGWAQWEPEREPFHVGMFFDLASVTKALATTSAVLLLVQEGQMNLNAPAAEYWPPFAAQGKGSITLRHLLTHTSGLPAWQPFYQACSTREEVFAAVAAAPLESAPGEVFRYSDLGFMTLGALVEQVAGQRLDEFCRERIFRPMGILHLLFVPPAEQWHLCVATERCPWRGRVLRGQVHDENAFACGGVAGHAGLFGTAEACGRFLLALLAALRGEETYSWQGEEWPTILEPETVQTMLSPQPGAAEEVYFLGWRRILYGEGRHRASQWAFGHWGFTGTMVWADPARDLVVVLLTNRVHPSRNNNRHAELRARWVAEALRQADREGA